MVAPVMAKKSENSWLVIGASGLLGWNFCKYLKQDNIPFLGTYRSHELIGENFLKFDIFNDQFSVDFEPTHILNTVSLTNVDSCEKDPHFATKLNVESVSKCLELKNKFKNAKLITMSTDQVHDGTKGNFKESEPPTFLNVYGRTKIEGENVALSDSDALVCRTNFYGNGMTWRESFSDWIIKNLKSGNEIDTFTDSFFNPLSTYQLYEAITHLTDINASGLFHACGKDNVSKHEFALRVASAFNLDKSLIRKALVEDRKLVATRPRNMTLNTEKLSGSGFKVPGLDEGLNQVLKEFKSL